MLEKQNLMASEFMPACKRHQVSSQSSLRRMFLSMLWPMILADVTQAASSVINMWWVERLRGIQAAAVVSGVYPFFLLLLPLIIGIGAGSSVLIGTAWGAGKIDEMRKIASNGFIVSISAGLCVGVLGLCQAEHMTTILHFPEFLQPDTIDYVRVVMLSMPALFALWYLVMTGRAIGDAVTPLWALTLAALLSGILTPLFLEAWRIGLPRFHVWVVALAAGLSYLLATIWIVVRWWLGQHVLALDHYRCWSIDFRLLGHILRIGIPTCGQIVAIAISELVLVTLVGRHGTTALAAYGAVNQIFFWIQFPIISIGAVTAILASQLIGAGERQFVPRVVRIAIALDVGIIAPAVLLLYLLSPILLKYYIGDAEASVISGQMIDIVGWSLLPLGLANIYCAVMRADKIVMMPTMLWIIIIFAIELPISIYFDKIIGLPGIWYGYAAGYMISYFLFISYYKIISNNFS